MNEKLKSQINLLPNKPGVYLMKDVNDKIIYIGKAKNLKNRVSQYFLRPQAGKVLAMVNRVDHFDIIIVHTDKEAFILEMNLIKEHRPRYNIMLIDDSHYPYIALNRDDAHLKITRNTNNKKYYYFGPYPSSHDAYKTLDLINMLYPTRKCKNLPSRACIYYEMGQCLAPCINKLSSETYDNLYNDIKKFLNGSNSYIIKELTENMEKASEELRYEDALYFKKYIDAINETTSKQTVEISTDLTSRDIIGYSSRDGYACIVILIYRRGILLDKKAKVFSLFGELNEQITSVLEQYYFEKKLPTEIVERISGFKDSFLEIYPDSKIIEPKEGRFVDQIDIATLNAQQSLDRFFMSAKLDEDKEALLEELGNILDIPTPYRIELFDNSHLQGSNAVAAEVTFINGEPAKSYYRKYNLSKAVAGDDYGSMKEVVRRRYKRLKNDNLEYPDLLLVDGGLGQVNAAAEIIDELDVPVLVYGLFKNDKHETEGIIDKEGEVYLIEKSSPLFFLLMRMQDEVHRFAINFHRSKRKKNMSKSIFDDIEGIGVKRKEMLMKHYPSIDALVKSSLIELKQLLPEKSAVALFNKIKSYESKREDLKNGTK